MKGKPKKEKKKGKDRKKRVLKRKEGTERRKERRREKGKKEGEPNKLISRYAAAKRLGITSTILRDWTRNRVCIADQKKGSRRGRFSTNKSKEDKMEMALFEEFKEVRKRGKLVGA